MFCLSSPSITDHSDYKNWTPLSGRLKCFEKLREFLNLIYPQELEENKIQPNSFLTLLKNSLITFSEQNKKFSKNDPQIISLLDPSLIGSYPNDSITLQDDLKNKQKSLKDDSDMYLKRSNSALKAIRNEKVSQSLKVNKISEISEQNDNYQPENDNEDDYKIQFNKISITPKSRNEKYVADDDDVEETPAYKRPTTNALSDLDKEEYYMKSCYEFFDYV